MTLHIFAYQRHIILMILVGLNNKIAYKILYCFIPDALKRLLLTVRYFIKSNIKHFKQSQLRPFDD